MDLDGRGSGEELGEFQGGKAITRIHSVRNESIFNKRETKAKKKRVIKTWYLREHQKDNLLYPSSGFATANLPSLI